VYRARMPLPGRCGCIDPAHGKDCAGQNPPWEPARE
jgi:hypothetical protein